MLFQLIKTFSVLLLALLAACGGGGEKSTAQVGNDRYVMHDFSLSPSTIKGMSGTTQLELYIKKQSPDGQIVTASNAQVSFDSPCLSIGRARVSPVLVSNGIYRATYTNMGCSGINGQDIIQAQASVNDVILLPIEKTLTITDVQQRLSDLIVSTNNDKVPADGHSKTLIKARAMTTVISADGSEIEMPVSGITVHFSTNKGELSATQAITDIDGYASVFLTSSTTAGMAQVTIEAEGTVRYVSIDMESFMPVATLMLDSGTTLKPNQSAVLAVFALDASGQPVAGANLVYTFVQNLSGAYLTSYAGTTDRNGRAYIQYTAGNRISDHYEGSTLIPDYDQIQVSTSSGLSQTTNIRVSNLANIPGSMTVIAGNNEETVPANGTTEVRITAHLLNLAGEPMQNTEVNFVTSLGIITASSLTDVNGEATALLKSAEVGDATVTASSQGIVRNISITFAPAVNVLGVEGAAAVHNPLQLSLTMASTGNIDTNTHANTTQRQAIRALAMRQNMTNQDTPSTQSVSGEEIQFAASSGALASTSILTDHNGYATVQLKDSSLTTSEQPIMVSAVTPQGYVQNIQLTDAQLQVTPRQMTLEPNKTTQIEAHLLDKQSRPIVDAPLFYQFVNDQPSGSLSAYSSVTNTDGQAYVQYHAGVTPTGQIVQDNQGYSWWIGQPDILEISSYTGARQRVALSVTPVQPYHRLILTTGGSDFVANKQASILLQAQLIDNYGKPLNNQLVDFSTTLGKLYDINGNYQTTAITDQQGIARIYLRVDEQDVQTITQIQVSTQYHGVSNQSQLRVYPQHNP